VVVLLLLVPSGLRAQQSTELVIALDLSPSVDIKGQNGRTNFQKNVVAVGQMLAEINPGTHVTVLGITDNSFGQPCVLLSAQLGNDAGYFGEKITGGRKQLTAAWEQKSRALTASCNKTDVFGVLLVADQLFRVAPTDHKKVLVIFSDMRQDTKEFAIGHHAIPDEFWTGYFAATGAVLRQYSIFQALSELRVRGTMNDGLF
jgi:hypothetical protein